MQCRVTELLSVFTRIHVKRIIAESLFALMTILSQSLLTLVGRNLVSFLFLTVWHSSILRVVFLLMLRAVFCARFFTMKLPNPRRNTSSLSARDFFTVSMKHSTVFKIVNLSMPVSLAISFTMSAFVIFLYVFNEYNALFFFEENEAFCLVDSNNLLVEIIEY